MSITTNPEATGVGQAFSDKIATFSGEYVQIVDSSPGVIGEVLTITGANAAQWLPSSGGGSGVPSDTVVTESSFGTSSTAGVASTYSRGDHTHGTPTNPVPAHEAASDPHPNYTLSSELTAHEAASDPHPTYALDSDLSSHVVAPDPHPSYQRESEKGTASGYASLDSGGKVPLAQIDYTGVQPLDSDLTTLAGLTPTTNNMIVSVGSAWASRTPAQVKTTLAIANTDVSGLGTLATQSGTFSGTSSGVNTGDQASIVGITGTKAQFDTAVTDGNFMYVGDAPTAHSQTLATISDVTMTVANLNSLDDGVNSTLHFHDTDRARATHTGTQLSSTISDFTEASQDAVGAMVDTSLTYVDATPLLQRSALTGAITASAGSNTTALGSFTTAQLNTALSDNDVATGGGTATGTNTGDNATNSQYSGLVSNATHTGDATGSGALTVVRINGVSLAGLATGILKNTTTSGVPSIATGADLPTMTASVGGAVPTPPNNTTTFLRGDGTFAAPTASAAWGSITGTLSSQTDLQTALDGKQPSGTYATGTGSASGTNTGDNATNTLYSGLAASKQDTLVSATNIKTINGASVLGSGNLVVTGGSAPIITRLTSTQQSTSVTLANITQLVAAMEINSTYRVTGFVTFQSAATTTGLNLGFTSPAGTTNQLQITVPITSTAAASQLRKTFPNAAESVSGSVLGTGVTAINSNHTASVSGIITSTGTAGNFQLQFATEVAASAITLQIGSSLILEKIA